MSKESGDTFIFDIDGTISNSDHRIDFFRTGQWDEFHQRCVDDAPFEKVVRLLHLVNSPMFPEDETGVILLTGRTADYEQITMGWLRKHEIFPEALLMRAVGDFRPDIEVKLEHIDKYFGGREIALARVIMIFEDREKLVEGLRNAGFTVAQVRNSTY